MSEALHGLRRFPLRGGSREGSWAAAGPSILMAVRVACLPQRPTAKRPPSFPEAGRLCLCKV